MLFAIDHQRCRGRANAILLCALEALADLERALRLAPARPSAPP